MVWSSNRRWVSWESTHGIGGLSTSLTTQRLSSITVTFESEAAESVSTLRTARSGTSSSLPVSALNSFAGPVATWVMSRFSGVFSTREGT